MSMQSYMAADLSEVFNRDMPYDCKIGSKDFTVIVDDLLNEEVEAYGGPEAAEMQRVHFQTSEKDSIEIGSRMSIRQRPEPGVKPMPWKSKIVLSSITSADGNELIVTVKGD
jgi:hypothetical protein